MTTQRILPPYAAKLGIAIDHAESTGAPVLIMPFADGLTGRPGFLHGGAIGGLLEMAALSALRAELDAAGDDAVIKPITVTVDYRRGGRTVDTYASGSISRLGSRIANLEAVAWQDDRARPVASARMNVLLRRAEP